MAERLSYHTSDEIIANYQQEIIPNDPKSAARVGNIVDTMTDWAGKALGANSYDRSDYLNKVIWKKVTTVDDETGATKTQYIAQPKQSGASKVLADMAYTAINMAPADLVGGATFRLTPKATAALFGRRLPVVGFLSSLGAGALTHGLSAKARENFDPFERGISTEQANQRLVAEHPTIGKTAEFVTGLGGLALGELGNIPKMAKSIKEMPSSVSKMLTKNAKTGALLGGTMAGIEGSLLGGINAYGRSSNQAQLEKLAAINRERERKGLEAIYNPKSAGLEMTSLEPITAGRLAGTALGAGLLGAMDAGLTAMNKARVVADKSAESIAKQLGEMSIEDVNRLSSIVQNFKGTSSDLAQLLGDMPELGLSPTFLDAVRAKPDMDTNKALEIFQSIPRVAHALGRANEATFSALTDVTRPLDRTNNEAVDTIYSWVAQRRALGDDIEKALPLADKQLKRIATAAADGWLPKDMADRAMAIMNADGISMAKRKQAFNELLNKAQVDHLKQGLPLKQQAQAAPTIMDVDAKYDAQLKDVLSEQETYMKAMEAANLEPSPFTLELFTDRMKAINNQRAAAVEKLAGNKQRAAKSLERLPLGDQPDVGVSLEKTAETRRKAEAFVETLNEMEKARKLMEEDARYQKFLKQYGLDNPTSGVEQLPAPVSVPSANPSAEEMAAQLQRKSRPAQATDILNLNQ